MPVKYVITDSKIKANDDLNLKAKPCRIPPVTGKLSFIQCGKLKNTTVRSVNNEEANSVVKTLLPEINDSYTSSGKSAVAMIEDAYSANKSDIHRLAVLSYEQVNRLNDVMNDTVCIHGRGNFPTIEVTLKDLVTTVRSKLEEACGHNVGLKVTDIRLNGGAASYVLDTEETTQVYNDLDLIFAVQLSAGRHFDRVKTAVLNSLLDLLPSGVNRTRISTCSLKEAYVSKLVKVNQDGDCWSLISLGNSRGHKNVELKFVDSMKRPFEFSVDSFQIILDSLLLFYKCSQLAISENFYPTVVGESVYGDFHEALYHLQKKLIATRNPEEIRGGGLLKYCHLLVRRYKPAYPDRIKMLERYMCSRFFIDFSDINQQRSKLENYLWNHFIGPEEEVLKYQYLILLRNVVDDSTVCLMGHERRQTLALIDELAYQIMYPMSKYYGPLYFAQAAATAGLYFTPQLITSSSAQSPSAHHQCACNSYIMTTASSCNHRPSNTRYVNAVSATAVTTGSKSSSSESSTASSPISSAPSTPPLQTV